MTKKIDAWFRDKKSGRKRVLVTVYDHGFAALASAAGMDGLLVGDSLGMVVQGHQDTLGVTLRQMVYHTGVVSRGAGDCLVLADLPLGTYEESPQQAWRSSMALLRAGADVIKWEGGTELAGTVSFCADRGLNVCAHIGLTPQRVRQWGRFQRQGATPEASERLYQEAEQLAGAGARFLLLEAVPEQLAREIARSVPVPVIGIGAGPDTDAQVLVLHDVLGLGSRIPPFAKAFAPGAKVLGDALSDYAEAVRSGRFPEGRTEG